MCIRIGDICLCKVIALKEKRFVLCNSGRIGETIAEVETGRMAPFAEVAIGVSCIVRFDPSKGFDMYIEGDEKVVEVCRSIVSECASCDHFTFEQRWRTETKDFGVLDDLAIDVCIRFIAENCNDHRGVEDHQIGAPAES